MCIRDSIGVADPTNHAALEEIKFHTNLAVEPILLDAERLKRSIDNWLEAAEDLADSMGDADGLEGLDVSGGGDEDFSGDAGVDAGGDDTPVVKFINKMLVDAIRKGASDIHFEPYETEYRVRFRIDGILNTVKRVPVKLHPVSYTHLDVYKRQGADHAYPAAVVGKQDG